MKRLLILLLVLSPIFNLVQAQEFRGAWVATVANLDWPTSRTASVADQKADLIGLLNQLKAAGTNAVLFQVRTEGDALYDSEIEPWSYYLTGVEGQAPNPYWDPLAFAVEEAHKRGMELHAWLNPYRADRVPGLFTRASNHITVTNPEWIITATSASSSIKIMNPGIPEVRDRITAVVMDIVRRYDIDGIHFDDYFYPYPPNDMGFNTPRWDLDLATFQQYGGGFSVRSDWRRHNINTMVKAVHDSIKTAKPHVKFGISPFGIWKSGVPSGIVGMDAYSVIYADAPAWLNAGSVDYLTPQLYWKYGGGQDYGLLAPWWAAQTAAKNRHIYHGLAPYRLPSGSGDWAIGDLTRQIRFNQSDANTHGQIMFRARSISSNIKNVADTLRQYYYNKPAFTPRADWLPTDAPPAPLNLTAERFEEGGQIKVRLNWDRPEFSRAGQDTLLFYLIHRESLNLLKESTDETSAIPDFVSVIGTRSVVDVPQQNANIVRYRVSALARNASTSIPSNSVDVPISSTSIDKDPEIASGIRLEQNYPNPFNPSTLIRFELRASHVARLAVYDVLGREVEVLVDGAMPAGQHSVTFDASSLSSGMYMYVLTAGDQRVSRTMTLIK